MSGSVDIGSRRVGDESPTFVIAEIGINHGGDVAVAERMIREAAAAGVDGVKLQTYRTEARVPADSPIFDVLKQAELDAEAHRRLRSVADDVDVLFISTPFDAESVELLSELDVPAYKIASFDIVNLELIARVAREQRPVFVSRGMADLDESDAAVELLSSHGARPVLLHCVSAYPLEQADANLAVIRTLRARYDCPVGYSDHTLGVEVAPLAVAVGASVIEKHFTLDRSAPGPDHALSADPAQMKQLIELVRHVESVLGSDQPGRFAAEEDTAVYRRPTAGA
ncbi:MAG: N-acetylneuraminate synthase family protein [Actinomycetota bacterium]|nr:N-acetylneuraminate synthase family protein [Actinomycetota bacterium]